MRKEVWPFLLGIFSWKSTAQERHQLVEALNDDYKQLQAKRHVALLITNQKYDVVIFHRDYLKEEAREGFEHAEVLIERDVVRTRCTFSDSTVQENTDLLRLIQKLVIDFYIYKPTI